MRDLLPELERWLADGPVAMATVVRAWGSSPRPVGSKMAISSSGEMAGSVSGGCVEGAVYQEARSVLESGTPKLLGYGVTDERAWEVGLSCGGEIEVFLGREETDDDLFGRLLHSLREDRLVALATVIRGRDAGRRLLAWPGGETVGNLGDEEVTAAALASAEELFASFATGRQTLSTGGEETEIFVEVHPPRRKLVVIGAVHVAVPLVDLAKRLGYRTIVVDPRQRFASDERFAHADELRVAWPAEALPAIGLDEATFVVALSHDFKIDVPALAYALEHPVRYIGALGSKRTHEKRVAELREAGVSDEQIERIHAPIGIDLGGRRAEEIALAIVAEMQAVHHRRSS